MMISKLKITKNNTIIEDINDENLKEMISKLKLIEDIEFNFKNINFIETNTKNSKGKSLILDCIRYILYPSKNWKSNIIMKNNEIISDYLKNNELPNSLFIFDIELEWTNGTKLKRTIKFNNKKGIFKIGDYFFENKKIKDDFVYSIFKKIYPSWPEKYGFKKIKFEEKNILNSEITVNKNKLLSSSSFLANFDRPQSNDNSKTRFFNTFKDKESGRTKEENYLDMFSLLGKKSLIDLKMTHENKKSINEIRESINEIDSELIFLNKQKKKYQIDWRDKKYKKLFNEFKNIHETIKILDEKILLNSIKGYEDVNEKNVINSELELIEEILKIETDKIEIEIENINNSTNFNKYILSLIDLKEYKNQIENERNKKYELLKNNFNVIEKEYLKIENEVKDLMIIAKEEIASTGAENLQKSMKIMNNFLKKGKLKDHPMLIIDNIADQKDEKWDEVFNPLFNIFEMNSFDQFFITCSNENANDNFKKRIFKENLENQINIIHLDFLFTIKEH